MAVVVRVLEGNATAEADGEGEVAVTTTTVGGAEAVA